MSAMSLDPAKIRNREPRLLSHWPLPKGLLGGLEVHQPTTDYVTLVVSNLNIFFCYTQLLISKMIAELVRPYGRFENCTV